ISGINVTDFVCPSCTNWSTPYLKTFVNHLKNTHDTNKNITIMCNLCNSVSSNARAFSQRVSKYHRTQDKAVKEDDELQILEESIEQTQPVIINTSMNDDDYMVTEEETSEEQLPTTLTEMNSFIKRISHFLLTLQSCFYISEAAIRYVATNLADLLEWLLVHPDQAIHGRKESVAAKRFCPCCDITSDNFVDFIDQDYNADGTLSTNIFKHNIMLQYVTTIPDGLILNINQLLLPSPSTSTVQIAKIDSIKVKRKQGLLTKRKKKQRKASAVIDIKEVKKIGSYETDTDEENENLVVKRARVKESPVNDNVNRVLNGISINLSAYHFLEV
ncbi:unnamed protein product, partial [Didymodactylos carnosus]